MGQAARRWHHRRCVNRWSAPMPQPNDLSRSLRWALPFGLRKSKIWDCRRRPWRLDKPARLAEEGGREPSERIALPALEQPAEQYRLLGGHAHALAVHRVEAADGVAEGKQPVRERFEPLEVPPKASRKAKANDVTEPFGVPDRVIQRRRPQLLSKSQKLFGTPRRLLTASAAEGHHPSAALQRHINPPRLLSRMLGSAFQSDGASSGIAKTAVA